MSHTPAGDALSLSYLTVVVAEATERPADGAEATFDPDRITAALIGAVTPHTRALLPHDLNEAVRGTLAAAPDRPDLTDPFMAHLPAVMAEVHHKALVLFDAFEPLRQIDAFTPRPTPARRPFRARA